VLHLATPKTHLFRTYLFVALMVLFGSIGNVLFSKGMKQMGEVNQWSTTALAALFVKILLSGWIWLGIAGQLGFLVAFLLVLSWADYSFVFPVSAISYAFVALLAHVFLGEQVSLMRWLGVGMISLGVVLVGRTPANTRERSRE